MRQRRSSPSSVVAAASCGFLAGVIVAAVVFWGFPRVNRMPTPGDQPPAERPLAAGRQGLAVVSHDAGHLIGAPPVPSSITPPTLETDPIVELRARKLELPVQGAVRQDLRDSFDETRESTRRHEAIDIMAPRNTPVLAVEDGTIARLFESKAGGHTVYQVDPAMRYAYYYAHLERYAEGLLEGHQVLRGQRLGYVGTSGNAPKDAPHLHFGIFRLTDKQRWWQGRPINPYDVLK
jgi:murein DD-endopeptidase MepM/ murein hydrolase activator NlpD